MLGQATPIKMVPVDAQLFEAVGYSDSARLMYIKFRNAPTQCFHGMPRFRYTGLMAAPRKDAYYNTYIKDRFLVKEAEPPKPV